MTKSSLWPLTEDELRAIRFRFLNAPEQFQTDADALISAILRIRKEVEAANEAKEEALALAASLRDAKDERDPDEIVKAMNETALNLAKLHGEAFRGAGPAFDAAKASLQDSILDLCFNSKKLAKAWEKRLSDATERAEKAEAALAKLTEAAGWASIEATDAMGLGCQAEGREAVRALLKTGERVHDVIQGNLRRNIPGSRESIEKYLQEHPHELEALNAYLDQKKK